MKLVLTVLGLCGLLFVEFIQAADDPECKFWNGLAYNLTHAGEQNGGILRFACNSSCSDIKCSGHFKPSMFASTFEMDICFGLRLNPCNTSMSYYVDVPNDDPGRRINISGSITHNSSFDIPGPKVAGFGSTVEVIVELVKINSHVKFGVNASVKVDIGGIPTFREARQVLPPMYIDVPPCTDSTKSKTPFKSPGVCTPLPVTATTPKSQTTKAMSTPKPVVNSKTYNRSCELGVENCGKYEMCKATTDKNKLVRSGVCFCQPETKFDGKTGFCKPLAQTTSKPVSTTKPSTNIPSVTVVQNGKDQKDGINSTSVSTTKPANTPSVTVAQNSKDKKGGINMTAVIIGCVFGGLLLIVVIVSIIVFIGRRRRQADYRGRHQLLSDNDDDDDDNVVI